MSLSCTSTIKGTHHQLPPKKYKHAKKQKVIRLQGTNVNEAQKLIQASGFRMIVVDDLEEAATKAVAVASIVQQASLVS